MIRKYFHAAAVLLGLALWGQPAAAGLTFCNKSDVLHSFAVAYKDGSDWHSEGWWNIDPGECKLVIAADLKNRYYYYRATAKGRDFEGERYFFCTRPSVFEILGEQGNCQARGYDRSEFRQLEMDEGITRFTLNLVPAQDRQLMQAKPGTTAPKPTGAAPGTYGEPYAADAVFQECVSGADGTYCAFHADGTKFYIYDDGRTPGHVFSFLRALFPGDAIRVRGDLANVFDSTAEVVLYEAARRSASRYDTYLARMQGSWYSQDDPNSQFTILGAERENTYDGQVMAAEFLSVSGRCDRFSGGGTYLYAREAETQESYCYSIERLTGLEMELMYLPGGNILRYRKLD